MMAVNWTAAMRNRDIDDDVVISLQETKEKDGNQGVTMPALAYVCNRNGPITDRRAAFEACKAMENETANPDEYYVVLLGGNHNSTSNKLLYEKYKVTDMTFAKKFKYMPFVVLYAPNAARTAAEREEFVRLFRAVSSSLRVQL